MAPLARIVVPGCPHHVTTRGNRREPIFFEDGDQDIYCDILAEQMRRAAVEVWSYFPVPDFPLPGFGSRMKVQEAFKIGLLRDLLEGTSLEDSASTTELRQGLQSAWTRQDRLTYVAHARRLMDRGYVTESVCSRLIHVLMQLGYSSEVLDVALKLNAPDVPPQMRCSVAAALLDTGRSAEARALARRIPKAASASEERFASAVTQLVEREDLVKASSSWPDFERYVRASLKLGMVRLATRMVLAGLERGAFKEAEDWDQALTLASCALRLAMPDDASRLAGSLNAALGAKPDRRSSDTDGGPPLARSFSSWKLFKCLALAKAAQGDWRGAIRDLEDLSGHEEAFSGANSELSRCIGREFLSTYPVSFGDAGDHPRTFDLFPFNGEFSMLRIKLNEMASWVDAFVIVEARQTFTGRDKPLYFLERQAEFREFAHKIIYVQLDEFPSHLRTAWSREFYQRDSAVRGISGLCGSRDRILISDVDEILDGKRLEAFEEEAVSVALRMFQFFLNLERVLPKPVFKTAIVPARTLAANGSSYLRICMPRYAPRRVTDTAGWHFSSVGEPAMLERKMLSYSHQENAHMDREHFAGLLADIRRGLDTGHHVRHALDSSFPAYVRQHQQALSSLLL